MSGDEHNSGRKPLSRIRKIFARKTPRKSHHPLGLIPERRELPPPTGFSAKPRKVPKEQQPPDSLRARVEQQYFAEAEPFEPDPRGAFPASASAWAPSKRSLRDVLSRWFHILAFHYPARLTIGIFAVLIITITLLLILPMSTHPGNPVSVVDAFFTAVSAVCVTGLTVVDTATQWTYFGEAVIMVGIALGGLGVMTMASLLALVVSRRLGLTSRLMVQSDTQSRIGETTSLVWGVLVTTIVSVLTLFAVIVPSFLRAGHSPRDAIWSAFFTAVSTFNNAGFINVPEGLEAYIGNWFVLIPLTIGAFVGAIGFPVISDLKARWRTPRQWTLHTKLTLSTFGIIAFVTAALVVAFEWTNPATFGALSFSEKILNGIMETVSPRSVGISAVDVSSMTSASWLITDISMFVGGGSGSHAGGLKVTTFAVLLLAAWAEARGTRDVQAFHRRIPQGTLRQAVAVLLVGVMLVLAVTLVLLILTPFTLDRVLFEVISAFGTVGLSTGITPFLSTVPKVLLACLMIVGRLGPMTLATALALKESRDVIRMPEERPIVG